MTRVVFVRILTRKSRSRECTSHCTRATMSRAGVPSSAPLKSAWNPAHPTRRELNDIISYIWYYIVYIMSFVRTRYNVSSCLVCNAIITGSSKEKQWPSRTNDKILCECVCVRMRVCVSVVSLSLSLETPPAATRSKSSGAPVFWPHISCRITQLESWIWIYEIYFVPIPLLPSLSNNTNDT